MLPQTEYEQRLEQALFVGMDMRALFSFSEREGEWYEGRIYELSPDYQTNPYQAVKVLWLEQDKESKDWVYAYTQTDTLLSTWEVFPSLFVEEEDLLSNKAARRSCLAVPSSFYRAPISPLALVKALKRLDSASPFLDFDVRHIPTFCAMFPAEGDQLTLHVIEHYVKEGRYDEGPSSSPSSSSSSSSSSESSFAFDLLFQDLERMVTNGKAFNDENRCFLVWRLMDAFEVALGKAKQRLVGHGDEEERKRASKDYLDSQDA